MDLAYAETNGAGDNSSLPHQYQSRGFALTQLALTFKGDESSFHGTYKAGPETIQYSATSPEESAVLKAFEQYVSKTAVWKRRKQPKSCSLLFYLNTFINIIKYAMEKQTPPITSLA